MAAKLSTDRDLPGDVLQFDVGIRIWGTQSANLRGGGGGGSVSEHCHEYCDLDTGMMFGDSDWMGSGMNVLVSFCFSALG